MRSDIKDQELEELFSKYIEERASTPSKDLTLKAKKYLNEQKEEKVLVNNATLATNNENITLDAKSDKQKYYIWSIFIAIILMITSFFIVKGIRNKENVMTTFNTLNDSDLNVIRSTYKNKNFLSFIDENQVSLYEEYELINATKDYKENTIVAYYVEYKTIENIDSKLYVELNHLALEKTSSYKNYNKYLTLNKTLIYGEIKNSSSYFYFINNNYKYNLELVSNDTNTINTILNKITSSF